MSDLIQKDDENHLVQEEAKNTGIDFIDRESPLIIADSLALKHPMEDHPVLDYGYGGKKDGLHLGDIAAASFERNPPTQEEQDKRTAWREIWGRKDGYNAADYKDATSRYDPIARDEEDFVCWCEDNGVISSDLRNFGLCADKERSEIESRILGQYERISKGEPARDAEEKRFDKAFAAYRAELRSTSEGRGELEQLEFAKRDELKQEPQHDITHEHRGGRRR